jgi:hypothetical protein
MKTTLTALAAILAASLMVACASPDNDTVNNPAASPAVPEAPAGIK